MHLGVIRLMGGGGEDYPRGIEVHIHVDTYGRRQHGWTRVPEDECRVDARLHYSLMVSSK